jgi:DNA-binding NarL/FixJ family response regulator
MPTANQPHKIQVVIADDHALFRASIKTILAEQSDFSIVGETGDGTGLCELIRDTKADVLLLDLEMPCIGGHEVLRHLKSSRSAVNTLVLTASENRLDLSLALELGAKGVVPKRASSRSLVEAIRRVEQGEEHVQNSVETGATLRLV